MYTTWIVIAHRTGARLFENHSPSRELVLVERIHFPEGNLQNREIDTDRPGQATGNMTNPQRNTYDPVQDAHDHLTDVFAKQLADRLDWARRKGSFQKLVLVAEPRFLGRLKGALPKLLEAVVHTTVVKELHEVCDRDIASRLGNLDGLWDDVHRNERFVPSTRVGER